MDKFVKPDKRVSDFRTWVSGVKPHDLKLENGALTFAEAKEKAHKILKSKKS